MDGYIKNKKEILCSVRKAIFTKYAFTIPLLLLAPVWLFEVYRLGSPDDWKSTEVVYSHISNEVIGFQKWKSYVLNSEDGGKYVMNSKLVSIDQLEKMLIAGETYSLAYSKTISGGNQIEELYNEQNIFLDHSVSVAAWEKERQECFLGLSVTIGLEIIALILIDRLWCKKEHAEIKKLRQAIEKRNSRTKHK